MGDSLLHLRDIRGYFLIETMITLFIVSACVMAVTKTAIFLIKTNSLSKNAAVASAIAQSKMEQIREKGLSSLVDGTFTESNKQNNINTEWSVRRNFPTINTASVSVTAKWMRGKDEKRIVFSTIIGR